MRAAPFHYAGFPDCFQKTVPSEKDFGKQYAYSMKVLFFLIYFQILHRSEKKYGNLKVQEAFRAIFPPDFQKACSGEKEFGKLIDNASFSPVFPSDFQIHPLIWNKSGKLHDRSQNRIYIRLLSASRPHTPPASPGCTGSGGSCRVSTVPPGIPDRSAR